MKNEKLKELLTSNDPAVRNLALHLMQGLSFRQVYDLLTIDYWGQYLTIEFALRVLFDIHEYWQHGPLEFAASGFYDNRIAQAPSAKPVISENFLPQSQYEKVFQYWGFQN